MAAIDYTVCLRSEVFVTTQGGNFPHFLMGHRRYLYGGHSKTIRPDKRKLAQIFGNPRVGYESGSYHVYVKMPFILCFYHDSLHLIDLECGHSMMKQAHKKGFEIEKSMFSPMVSSNHDMLRLPILRYCD